MWTTIKKILPFSINKLGLGQLLGLSEISLNWDKIMENLFGLNFKNKAKPISLKNKVLVVDCLNSSWASELQLKQEKIIKEISRLLKKEAVEKIRFIS